MISVYCTYSLAEHKPMLELLLRHSCGFMARCRPSGHHLLLNALAARIYAAMSDSSYHIRCRDSSQRPHSSDCSSSSIAGCRTCEAWPNILQAASLSHHDHYQPMLLYPVLTALPCRTKYQTEEMRQQSVPDHVQAVLTHGAHEALCAAIWVHGPCL